MSIPRPPQESWDCMLPGPPSRNNGGSADVSPSGLLAYAAGSSVAVLDCRSMQLVSVVPLPPPPPSTTSSSPPFVTSVRWSPHSLPRDPSSASHIVLAAGDRQGRIALLDLRLKSPLLFLESSYPKSGGIQDLCWVQTRPDSWILAALSGPSLLSLYNTSSGCCFYQYDATSEFFSCVRRDPFDSRHFCALGLKGFLLSVMVLGDTENDVVIKELQIPTDTSELQRLEREGVSNTASSPALAALPTHSARLAFSPQWRHILFATFPRELVVFDLQYETALSAAGLPRGCGRFMNVLADPNLELLYCLHLDGRLSAWRRKEGEQVHMMCMMEELMPSVGTSVPSPSVLAVAISQSDPVLQNIGKLCSDIYHSSSPDLDFDTHLDFCDESHLISKIHLISISDDGKIWSWLLTAEGPGDAQKDARNFSTVDEGSGVPVVKTSSRTVASCTGEPGVYSFHHNIGHHPRPSTISLEEMSFKISLVGQLHLLSSTVTMLAVPSPSLTATMAGGGNRPAVAIPLVALGTQNGTLDVIDVSANAVAASFSVHNSTVRGLRWLGNTRLVSFSYTQGNEKTAGYINRLVVTCVRSGQNRPFRALQKPERAPIRALRASPSGRYLLILFRDAPVEVWAMTMAPIMLRSLALPFTVLEWTLPTIPWPIEKRPSRQWSLSSKGRMAMEAAETSSPVKASSKDSKGTSPDGSQDDSAESFAFALLNGAIGVFEVHGRRIRDFRPKWPSSSFVSSDGLITAMAYRQPHVVMGEKSGNILWWDVTTGQSSSFNTHKEGILRIKFSPVVPGDSSHGRIAVLFYDNTVSVFDLYSQDPLANSLLQPYFIGILVREVDWLPLRTDKSDPLVLCIAGTDSSFRLVEVNVSGKRPRPRSMKERFRPMPLCSPILLPTPHALGFRMILQLGVKPAWFNACSTTTDKRHGTASSMEDLRGYMINAPPLGDSVVAELLLKVLEPYRKEGSILDDERAKLYASIVNKCCATRFAFAAAIFGDSAEALFWLQLPQAINHLVSKLVNKSPLKAPEQASSLELSRIVSKDKSTPRARKTVSNGPLKLMAFEQEELWGSASERIPWHEKLDSEEAIQKRVHELVSIGNLEATVSLLLSTHPESTYFYGNALRAVALSSAVSRSLLELTVKVVAANMVRTDRSFSGTHLLCAVGRYREACSQLQDAGCWTDAATLAATHLKGPDYARVLQRWAGHVLRAEHNIWRALILYAAAGAFQEALVALREAQLPDTAAMFIFACREIHAGFLSSLDSDEELRSSITDKPLSLPALNPENEDVIAIGEYFEQYQRELVHLCMDSQPFAD